MGAFVGVVLVGIVVVALGIALAPYVLPGIGWMIVAVLVVAAWMAVVFVGHRFGAWYDETRIGRWLNEGRWRK